MKPIKQLLQTKGNAVWTITPDASGRACRARISARGAAPAAGVWCVDVDEWLIPVLSRVPTGLHEASRLWMNTS